MKKHFERSTVRGLMAALCLGAAALAGAGIPKRVAAMEHALGWDSLSLKVIEKDADGRPTLEGESNSENRVARRTSYYPSGKKAAQTFTVVELATDKTLYLGKRDWIENGDLDSSYVRDDIFNEKGHPKRGWVNERHFRKGRLVMDVKRNYYPETGDWLVLYRQTLSYFDDGDLQERITENPPSKKTWETWGPKEGGAARKLTLKKWNAAGKNWQ